jgi:hypothetical protein
MKRDGYTLLEILLALALTVVVLGLLGMAVDVHLRTADAGRSEVEQSQEAEILLQRLADDLRNAIPIVPGNAPLGNFQGDRNELQFDVSRMPELEEPRQATPFSQPQQPLLPPADVRTVWYLAAKPEDVRLPEKILKNRERRVLFRGESERAVFAWASQQDRTEAFRRGLKVFSPNVEAIEFTYFDGGVEYTQWDAQEKKKLPTAVRIAVASRRLWQNPAATAVPGEDLEKTPAVFEILVDLPNGRSTLAQTAAAIGSTPAASSSNSQQSNSQQGGSGGQSSGGSSTGGSGS